LRDHWLVSADHLSTDEPKQVPSPAQDHKHSTSLETERGDGVGGEPGERIMTRLGRRTEGERHIEVENRAIAYLAKLSPDVAISTALMLAFLLGVDWSLEYSAILQRGENPEGVNFSELDVEILAMARRAPLRCRRE
jgi:hypothetical protein